MKSSFYIAHPGGGGQQGFSLLEVMIALAIMVSALVMVSQAQIDATIDTGRAKMMTVGTMLARAKMNEIEFELFEDGFPDFEENECGTFADEAYGGLDKFKWCYTIVKIELPENLDLQRAFGLGSEEDGEGISAPTSPLMSMLGSMGGGSGLSSLMSGGAMELIASQFGIIQNVIEQAIRRVTLTVSWGGGLRDNEITVIAYFTDPDVIDRQIMGGMGAPGAPVAPSAPGTPGAQGAPGTAQPAGRQPAPGPTGR